MSRLDPSLEPNGSGIRRIELITGAGGRQRWSEGEKALAAEESLVANVVVSHDAFRHGATPQQLFTWRGEARRRVEAAGCNIRRHSAPFIMLRQLNFAERGTGAIP